MTSKQFQKDSISERFQNFVYSTVIYSVEEDKNYEIVIQQTRETEADILKMIRIANGSIVNEWSFEYDFLKSVIEKYAIN